MGLGKIGQQRPLKKLKLKPKTEKKLNRREDFTSNLENLGKNTKTESKKIIII